MDNTLNSSIQSFLDGAKDTKKKLDDISDQIRDTEAALKLMGIHIEFGYKLPCASCHSLQWAAPRNGRKEFRLCLLNVHTDSSGRKSIVVIPLIECPIATRAEVAPHLPGFLDAFTKRISETDFIKTGSD